MLFTTINVPILTTASLSKVIPIIHFSGAPIVNAGMGCPNGNGLEYAGFNNVNNGYNGNNGYPIVSTTTVISPPHSIAAYKSGKSSKSADSDAPAKKKKKNKNKKLKMKMKMKGKRVRKGKREEKAHQMDQI